MITQPCLKLFFMAILIPLCCDALTSPNSENKQDILVCSGPTILGYISQNQASLGEFYTYDGTTRSQGLGQCGCASLNNRVLIWTCETWPQLTLPKNGTLPFCTSKSRCPQYGEALAIDDRQQAKICSGSQQVGLLYSNGWTVPNSGAATDSVYNCTCSGVSTISQLSTFSCPDPKHHPNFQLDSGSSSNKLTCVNPLNSCRQTELPQNRTSFHPTNSSTDSKIGTPLCIGRQQVGTLLTKKTVLALNSTQETGAGCVCSAQRLHCYLPPNLPNFMDSNHTSAITCADETGKCL
ncbi:hypothetical protein O181_001154 [Austropuccinia psidii MF-1]|uniref:Uncharacterized protein n=1 Tax=Austropuccinia psidii MF-1 TaxID=1389203 RepID=A0A9Q3GBK5_9BASI|nr:hypothetical protein [Austropuccinia psidii MF-1]